MIKDYINKEFNTPEFKKALKEELIFHFKVALMVIIGLLIIHYQSTHIVIRERDKTITPRDEKTVIIPMPEELYKQYEEDPDIDLEEGKIMLT